MDDLKFISPEAFEAHLCKEPLVHQINGEPMTFLCLRMRGHEGVCKAAVAMPLDEAEKRKS